MFSRDQNHPSGSSGRRTPGDRGRHLLKGRASLKLAGLTLTALVAGVMIGSGQTQPQAQTPAPVVEAPPSDATAPSVAAPVPASAPADSSAGKVIVPANTTVPLELRNTINTRTAQVGQTVYCTTLYPVVVKNRIVIPVGSYVKGRLTEVKRPGRVKGKAELAVVFQEITLPNGVTKSLRNASLSGYGGSGNEGFNSKEGKIQGEGTKAKDAETVAITGAEGAGIGSIAGISAGHSGAGAAAGGMGGALGGLIYVLASRGKEVVLPAGTSLELTLAIPLTYDEDDLQPSSEPSGPDLGRRDPGPGY
jgi:hypothetical protein